MHIFKLRKLIALLICLVLALAVFAGCSSDTEPDDTEPTEIVEPVDEEPSEEARTFVSTALSTTMEYGGIERMYQYYIPSSWNKDAGMPLMITLHGMGSSSSGQLDITEFELLAEREGFVLLAPNSTIIDEEGNITSDGRSWYDDPDLPREGIAWNAGYPSLSQEAGIDDVGYISALIDLFAEEYGIDTSRVYATGMSNGGIFSMRLAIELSDKIAAIGSVTGPLGVLMEDRTPVEPIKVVLVMSTDDPVVAYEGSAALLSCDATVAWWTGQYGLADVDPVVTELPQTVADDPTSITRYEYASDDVQGVLVLYVVEGGGHTWPGGYQYLPVESVGLASQQASATQFLWDEVKGISKQAEAGPEPETEPDTEPEPVDADTDAGADADVPPEPDAANPGDAEVQQDAEAEE